MARFKPKLNNFPWTYKLLIFYAKRSPKVEKTELFPQFPHFSAILKIMENLICNLHEN